MTAPTLASPAAEVRRLRAELADLHRLVAALLDAIDPAAEIRYRRALAREAADAGRERAWSQGYAAAIADVKAADHAIPAAIRRFGRPRPDPASSPAGAAWLASVIRNGGTEYAGAGRPRVPVPATVIERAKEAQR
jgi:hypothetical protein